jgi:hypothetical protein
MASQRISLGFQASPPIALRVSEDALAGLRDALEGGGWHEVAADDGTVRMNLQYVLWLKVDKDEPRVGFGLSG